MRHIPDNRCDGDDDTAGYWFALKKYHCFPMVGGLFTGVSVENIDGVEKSLNSSVRAAARLCAVVPLGISCENAKDVTTVSRR